MKKVTSADSLVTISHYRNLLEAEGIEAFIRNEHLGSILGEMPFQEVWPEVWVRNDIDLDRARQLIDETIVEEMLAGVECERGALPMVAFSAAQLWERRAR